MDSPMKNKYKQRVQQQMLTNYYLQKVDKYMSKLNDRRVQTKFTSREPPLHVSGNPKRKNFKQLLLQRKGAKNKRYSDQENKQQSDERQGTSKSGRKNFKQQIQIKKSKQKSRKQNKKNFLLLQNTIVNQLYKPSPSPMQSGKFEQIQIVHKVTYYQEIQKQKSRSKQKIEPFRLNFNEEQQNIQINYQQNLMQQAEQSDAKEQEQFKIKMEKLQHSKIAQAIKQTFQKRSPTKNNSAQKKNQMKNNNINAFNSRSKQKQKIKFNDFSPKESPKFNKEVQNIQYFKKPQIQNKYPLKYQSSQPEQQYDENDQEIKRYQTEQNPYKQSIYYKEAQYSKEYEAKFGNNSQQDQQKQRNDVQFNKSIGPNNMINQPNQNNSKNPINRNYDRQFSNITKDNPLYNNGGSSVGPFDIKKPPTPTSRKDSIQRQKSIASDRRNKKQSSVIHQNNASSIHDDSFHRSIPEIEQQPKINTSKQKIDQHLNSSNYDSKSNKSNSRIKTQTQGSKEHQFDFSIASKFSINSEQGNAIKQELQREINDNQFGPYQNSLTNLLDLINEYSNAWPIFVVGQRILQDRRQYENKRQTQQNQMSKLQMGIQNMKKNAKKRSQTQQNYYTILKLVRQLAKSLQQ